MLILEWLDDAGEALTLADRQALVQARRALLATRYAIPSHDPRLDQALAFAKLPLQSIGEFLGLAVTQDLDWRALDKDVQDRVKTVTKWLEAYAGITPTPETFADAVAFYRALRAGPVRPITFEDLEAIAVARAQLMAYAPYFRASGQAHQVAPDVLAAVALWNTVMKDQHLAYSLLKLGPLLDGLGKHTRDRGWLARANDLLRKLPQSVKDAARVQDRLSDDLGALAGAHPTYGLMEIRSYQVRPLILNAANLGLAATPDMRGWSNRRMNWHLRDPRWNIEAAAAFYEQGIMAKGSAKQAAGLLRGFPPLGEFSARGWLWDTYDPLYSRYGPDILFGLMSTRSSGPDIQESHWDPAGYMVDAMKDVGSPWLPLFRVMAFESGILDTTPVPARIVGIRNEVQLLRVYELAQGRDDYLGGAALRSLRELATQPDFPHRRQVQDWLSQHAPRVGLEERETAVARDMALAAWWGVPPIVGPEDSTRSAVLIFHDQLDLAALAVQQGLAIAVPVDGPEATGLEDLLAHVPGPKGSYAIGPKASARFLQEYPEASQIPTTSRQQFFTLVGLEEDHLLVPVRQALTATRDFLALAA